MIFDPNINGITYAPTDDDTDKKYNDYYDDESWEIKQ